MFAKLVDYLKDHQIKHTLSDKYFKIEFEAERMQDKIDDSEEEEKDEGYIEAVEKVIGKIEIQKVDETIICVDFSRKAGSSLLFYDNFKFIKKDLAELGDAKFEVVAWDPTIT